MNQFHKQRGVTLIESMIAILILSFAMISMIKLQMGTLRASSDSRYDLIATARAQEIMEQIAYLNLSDSQWTITAGGNAPAGNVVLQEWATGLATGLPSGTGAITCASRLCSVTLTWTPPGAATASSATYEVVN